MSKLKRTDYEAMFETSKFQVRYERGRFRDRIGKAVWWSDFLDYGYTKKDLARGEYHGWLKSMVIYDPAGTGSHRSVVVLTTIQMPQSVWWKGILAGEWTLKGLASSAWRRLSNRFRFPIMKGTTK